MTLVVPFDGSEFAEIALARARDFGEAFDREVVAVTVIPHGNADYAREQGWLQRGESFDIDVIHKRLTERIRAVAADAKHKYIGVDRYAPRGVIASRIRRYAREVDAKMVFIGSTNAGRVVTNLGSVGGSIAGDQGYDVVIVRNRELSETD
jgi:nucleotide-binding universal stress UspA family protein